MKKLLLIPVICFAALAGALHALAQSGSPQTKPSLSSEINTMFPNNISGQIAPSTARQVTQDIVSSMQQFGCVNAQTGTSYTFQLTDYGCLVTFTNIGAVSVTLPQANMVTGFSTWNAYVTNNGNGTVTITPNVSTINGSASLSIPRGQGVWVVSDGVNYQVFSGGATGIIPGICSEATSLALGCINLSHAYTFTTVTTFNGSLNAGTINLSDNGVNQLLVQSGKGIRLSGSGSLQVGNGVSGAFIGNDGAVNDVVINPGVSSSAFGTDLVLNPSTSGTFIVLNATNSSAIDQLIIGTTSNSPTQWLFSQTVGGGGSCLPVVFQNATPTTGFTLTCDPHLLIPNNIGIYGRNSTNSADVELLFIDNTNNIHIAPNGSVTIGNSSSLSADPGVNIISNFPQTWEMNVSRSNGNLYLFDATNGKFPFVVSPGTNVVLNIGASIAGALALTGNLDVTGSIDNSIIGANTAAAATFTTATMTNLSATATSTIANLTLTATPTLASSKTGAGTQTFTNSPCSGLTSERWIPVQITGQTGSWFIPACQ